MTAPIASTDIWNIYQLPNGHKINILRPEISVALAASRFQYRVERNPIQREDRMAPPLPDPIGGPGRRS